jgi:tetratricopeptide (TPR) repeat protein
MLRVLIIAGLVLGAAPACSGSAKPAKTAKKDKKLETRGLVEDARQNASSGELDAADRAYSEAYESSKDVEIFEEHINFLIQFGKTTRALELARAHQEANPNEPKALQLLAEALIAAGKGVEALKVAEEILKANAEDPAGYEKKGRALVLLEKPDEGLEALRKAVQLDDEHATYHIALGLALYNAKKVNEAALVFRTAVKRGPNDAKAHIYLGMALRDQDERTEAKEELERALELDPNNGQAYFEIGLLYNKEGKQADAEQALSKAVQKQPNQSLYWYAYGEIYRLQQRNDEAISAYRKALDIDPPYAKAITKLGVLLADRKDFDEAEKVLIIGVRKEPKNPGNYLALGDLYVARRRPKDAVFYYEQYLELAPKTDRDRNRVRDALPALKRKR